MATSSSISGAVFGQLQQQQAQRIADQAERNARALQQKAAQAEGEASRAQERARAVRVDSDKAERGLESARQNLASIDSASRMYEDLGRRVSAVNDRLNPPPSTDTAPPAASAPSVSATGAALFVPPSSGGIGATINVTA